MNYKKCTKLLLIIGIMGVSVGDLHAMDWVKRMLTGNKTSQAPQAQPLAASSHADGVSLTEEERCAKKRQRSPVETQRAVLVVDVDEEQP